jgi:Protein of unknown function (DUF5818)
MSIGSHHTLTGLLLDGGRFPVLRVDVGGEWRVDLPSRYQSLVGKRVSVTGVRVEFDLLEVSEAEIIN